jgi:hypothetical protein
MSYPTYPHPGPNDLVQKTKDISYYSLPPPNQTYTGIQGTDYTPKPNDQVWGFPSHPGGYRTTPEGLNIAATPWNMNLRNAKNRQDRANDEALIAAYWPQSPMFGPQGTNPSYNTLLT